MSSNVTSICHKKNPVFECCCLLSCIRLYFRPLSLLWLHTTYHFCPAQLPHLAACITLASTCPQTLPRFHLSTVQFGFASVSPTSTSSMLATSTPAHSTFKLPRPRGPWIYLLLRRQRVDWPSGSHSIAYLDSTS
jgi:hypothetical protein